MNALHDEHVLVWEWLSLAAEQDEQDRDAQARLEWDDTAEYDEALHDAHVFDWEYRLGCPYSEV